MPGPEPELLTADALGVASIALEPAHNVMASMHLLNRCRTKLPPTPWVEKMLPELPDALLHRVDLAFEGLSYATIPIRSWPSFPDYLDELKKTDPNELRDRVLRAYAQMPLLGSSDHPKVMADVTDHSVPFDHRSMLSSRDAFFDYMLQRYDEAKITRSIEEEAYEYLVEPPRMRDLLVSTMQELWEGFLEKEWIADGDALDACIQAFEELEPAQKSKIEVAREILGAEKADHYRTTIESMDRVIFVPSRHVGAYNLAFRAGSNLWIIFGARVPKDSSVTSPELDRGEILLRMSALADETRLRILELLSSEGELRSQDIMQRLSLSQSAASRHLNQLSANGFLRVRKHEGAKAFRINPDRVDEVLQNLSHFLRAE
jgi:DNA-binding transcriptional ArsR family regulator